MELKFLLIPTELLDEVGITPDSVLQLTVVDNKLIVETVTDDDFECDGDCESCPFYWGEDDCDGDCDNCPCSAKCDKEE
jgi:hypothetical protein